MIGIQISLILIARRAYIFVRCPLTYTLNRKLQRKGEENCKTVTSDNVEHEWSLHLKCEIKQPPL